MSSESEPVTLADLAADDHASDDCHCNEKALPHYEEMIANLPRTQAAGEFVTWLWRNHMELPGTDQELEHALLRWTGVNITEYHREHNFLAALYDLGNEPDEPAAEPPAAPPRH